MKVKTTPARAYNLEFKRGKTTKCVQHVTPGSVVEVIQNWQADGWILTCVTAVR